MKISQKTINGKRYLYIIDSVYISRGKNRPVNKSLGPTTEALASFQLSKQEFLNFLIREESSSRYMYWKSRASDNFMKFVNIRKIEQLRAELFRRKQNMGGMGIAAMDTAFLVDFIYNSNKIEGSRVPRESIERIVRDRAKEKNEEVQNTVRAISMLKEKKFIFSIRNIERLHSVLLAHEPRNLGYRKNNDIVVGNAPVSDYRTIREELTLLLEWNKKQNHIAYPLEQAFTFYYKFERIHPFRDGNGRVGRLIMNEILKSHRYHPIIVWNRRRQAHMHVFERAMDGSMYQFFKFMAEQFIETHKLYLEKIEHAYNLEQQMSYFLKPSQHDK